jgi:Ca-activated chloride channel homolog
MTVTDNVSGTGRGGQHRGSRARRRGRLAVTGAAVLLAVAVAVAIAGTGGEAPEPAGCSASRTLRVAAASEIAPAVRAVAGSYAPLRCARIEVTAADPADVAAGLKDGASSPDVWVPDSSMWVAEPTKAASWGTAAPRSVALSPVVLGVDTRIARRLHTATSYEEIARWSRTGRPIVLRTGAPPRSATSLAALVDLMEALDVTPAQRGYLAALLRAMDTTAAGNADPPARPEHTVDDHNLTVARATTERAVWAANQARGRRAYKAVYPPSPGRAMDYPYVVLTSDPGQRSDAGLLLSALTSAAGQSALNGLGFRTPEDPSHQGDDNGSPLTKALGVDPMAAAGARAMTSLEAQAAMRTLALLDRPSRALALVDVSGSMALTVPGTAGATRLEVARAAIRQGLALFPQGTVAGLWRFSAALTPSTDYQEVVPLTALTPTSRRKLAAAVDGLEVVPNGGTSLYSSILDAVRYVRAGYDPTRVNSVIVLSDGKDEYAGAHGISLSSLLERLRTENDPERPVVVISIAYGPDSDVAALRTITAVTGGTLYTSRDPRDLPVIFREAIGHRLCTTSCP